MREILFRGKRKDNGKWIEGYFYKIWDKVFLLWGMTGDNPNIEEVIPKTVGQYTGLKDKNGKKIFDGDIIKPYIIGGAYDRFLFPNGAVVFEYGAFRIKDSRQSTPLSSYAPRVAFEVIGNIYDNPELLEEEV